MSLKHPLCGNSSDRGSTLVAVLIVMLVLSMGSLVIASIVVNTSGMVVNSRDRAQARAAADAGIADVADQALRGTGFCNKTFGPVSLETGGASPRYEVTTKCDDATKLVTLTSTGTSHGATTRTEAVYAYQPAPPRVQKEPALLTRAPLNLASLKITAADPSSPATVWVVPDPGQPGDFTCDTGGAIAGSVYLPAGTVLGSGGCEVTGDIYAERDVTIGGGTKVHGDVVSLNGNVRFTGGPTVDGSVYAKGSITGTGLSPRFAQSLHAGGNIDLGSMSTPAARDQITYGGTITAPPGSYPISTWAVNSVTKSIVTMPSLPVAPTWQGLDQSDLDALVANGVFAKVKWTGACSYSWDPVHEMISKIQGFTTPTIVDASACSKLDLHQYSGTTMLKTDIVIVAPSFNIEDQEFESADGREHKLWIVSPEAVGRDCTKTPSSISIKGTTMTPIAAPKISGLIFTQCTVDFPNGGEGWQGSIQAGTMTGKPNFRYKPVGFPGQILDSDTVGGGVTTPPVRLGALLSQRDLP